MGLGEKRTITYGSKNTKRRRQVHLAPIDIDHLPPDSFLTAPMNSTNYTSSLPNQPNRPQSQREAIMSVEPTQEAVDEVVMFTMTSVGNARKWLSVSISYWRMS